jgi:hypothetical protein
MSRRCDTKLPNKPLKLTIPPQGHRSIIEVSVGGGIAAYRQGVSHTDEDPDERRS